jgi:hypothetical protein
VHSRLHDAADHNALSVEVKHKLGKWMVMSRQLASPGDRATCNESRALQSLGRGKGAVADLTISC